MIFNHFANIRLLEFLTAMSPFQYCLKKLEGKESYFYASVHQTIVTLFYLYQKSVAAMKNVFLIRLFRVTGRRSVAKIRSNLCIF